jgi:hypothetical protein
MEVENTLAYLHYNINYNSKKFSGTDPEFVSQKSPNKLFTII